MTAAERIRTARRAAGLSQADLAARSGVRQPNIAAYEKGSRSPSAAMVERLLAAARGRPAAALEQHRTEVLRIAAANRAHNVRVFGSVARGDDKPGSDVDLLVEFDNDATLFDQVALSDEVERLLGVSVDVVSERALRDEHDAIRHDAVPL